MKSRSPSTNTGPLSPYSREGCLTWGHHFPSGSCPIYQSYPIGPIWGSLIPFWGSKSKHKEGGTSAGEDIRMFATGRLTPRIPPSILLYLSQSPSTPTWAPNPAKGLAQHYILLQERNSYTGSSTSFIHALVPHPADLTPPYIPTLHIIFFIGNVLNVANIAEISLEGLLCWFNTCLYYNCTTKNSMDRQQHQTIII